MLALSLVAMLVGVAATVWAFATDREHGALQLGALAAGSTLALVGAIATVICVVSLI